jgi:hypothetical protein
VRKKPRAKDWEYKRFDTLFISPYKNENVMPVSEE